MTLTLHALSGVGEVGDGDDLVEITLAALGADDLALRKGDVVVVAQKIVSKAEGRGVWLDEVVPSPRALALANDCDKDARLVELVLAESSAVLRAAPGVLVVEHRLGVVMANAGIDASNLPPDAARERVLLLPADPDESCARLRRGLRARTGVDVGVIVSDSVGRAWRLGVVGLALGVSGMAALKDLRDTPDRHGRPMRVSETAIADQLASAAVLAMGEAGEGTPIVLARGLPPHAGEGRARDLLRPLALDLFR